MVAVLVRHLFEAMPISEVPCGDAAFGETKRASFFYAELWLEFFCSHAKLMP